MDQSGDKEQPAAQGKSSTMIYICGGNPFRNCISIQSLGSAILTMTMVLHQRTTFLVVNVVLILMTKLNI